jgi:hypothetical protein
MIMILILRYPWFFKVPLNEIWGKASKYVAAAFYPVLLNLQCVIILVDVKKVLLIEFFK